MKRAFENSCIKGCAIYFGVLVIIVVASAAGFGGLSARFGMSSPAVQGSRPGPASGVQEVPAPQATTGAAAQTQPTPAGGASSSAPVIATNPPAQQEQAPVPTQTPTAVVAPIPPPVLPSAPPSAQGSYAPQVQAQGGDIQGQASQPFYIVESNDTLSGIASRFSTTVEALRQANNLDDVNSIWPGQLLYLPQDSSPAQPSPQGQTSGGTGTDTGQATGGGSATQGGPGSIPSMPNTGINSGR